MIFVVDFLTDEFTEAMNNLSVASSAAVLDGSASTIINCLGLNSM